MLHQGERLGALSVTMPPSDPMDPARHKLVEDLAAQAGLVLRNVRLIEELRASRQRLVAAQDEERRRLERNLHDGAQQQLVALSVQLKLARSMLDRDATKTGVILDGLQATAGDALEDLRDLARGIYPPLLADKGLPTALEAQARKAAVPTTVNADGVARYSQDVEATVYFCVLEALNNVAKYADASKRLGLPHQVGWPADLRGRRRWQWVRHRSGRIWHRAPGDGRPPRGDRRNPGRAESAGARNVGRRNAGRGECIVSTATAKRLSRGIIGVALAMIAISLIVGATSFKHQEPGGSSSSVTQRSVTDLRSTRLSSNVRRTATRSRSRRSTPRSSSPWWSVCSG